MLYLYCLITLTNYKIFNQLYEIKIFSRCYYLVDLLWPIG